MSDSKEEPTQEKIQELLKIYKDNKKILNTYSIEDLKEVDTKLALLENISFTLRRLEPPKPREVLNFPPMDTSYNRAESIAKSFLGGDFLKNIASKLAQIAEVIDKKPDEKKE